MDTQKFIALFVEEARDIAAKIAASLGVIEERGFDEAAVNELFRAAHSLKGMASSMGFDGLTGVAHRLEDAFARVRETREAPSPETLKAAFAAADYLSGAVEEIASGGQVTTPAASVLELLDGAISGAAAPAPPRASEDEPTPMEIDIGIETAHGAAKPAAPAVPSGKLLKITFRMDPTDPLPAARAMVACRSLTALASAVEAASPSVESLSTGKFAGTMTLALRSARPKEEFEAALKAASSVAEFRVEEVRAEAPAPEEGEAAAAPQGPIAQVTVRVPVKHLDHFFDYASEFIIHHGRLDAAAQAGSLSRVTQRLDRLRRLIEEFYAEIVTLRMMPFSILVPALERTVRDAARLTGKETRLKVEGADVRLDRSILDRLAEPLTHVLRNAVDHGIEPSGARAAAGKPPAGEIRITLERRGDSVRLAASDDGAGMDPERMKASAIEKGYLAPERSAALSASEALMLCTLPGFSTRADVSTLSGRGVGMDVVRTSVENLGGHLRLSSEKGKGTEVLFILPPTVSIMRAFLVETDSELYAMPLHHVQRAARMDASTIQRVQGRDVAIWQGRSVFVHTLRRLLRLPIPETPRRGTLDCLVARHGEEWHAVAVDKIVGTADIVVKPLKIPLDEMRQYSGAAVYGEGRIALILDVENLLIQHARAGEADAAPASSRESQDMNMNMNNEEPHGIS